MSPVMPNDVQVLLSNIAAGFRQNIPVEVVSSAVLVGAITGLLYAYERQRRNERRNRIALQKARYERLLDNLSLPAGSLALLDRLARRLRAPGERYLLLESEACFNSCLRRLTAEEKVSPSLVAALRIRLGYRTFNPERIPRSSGDLPDEATVLLAGAARLPGEREYRVVARIDSVSPDSIAIDVDGQEKFRRGEGVRLYFTNFAGFYRMKTRVIGKAEGKLLLSHSSSIVAVQRRNYYRRRLDAPAFIRRSDVPPAGVERRGDEGKQPDPSAAHQFERSLAIRTLLRDLGGGGARLVNPHSVFEFGDHVEIAIDLGFGRWAQVPGVVVREGKDGTISVRFVGLRETTRDAILRALFRRYNQQAQEHAQGAGSVDA